MFRLVGGEKQEQSTKPEDIDALMNQFGLNDPPPTKKKPVANEVKDPKKKGKKAKEKKTESRVMKEKRENIKKED